MSDVSFNIYLIIVLSKVLILFGLFSIWIVWFILHFQLAQCGGNFLFSIRPIDMHIAKFFILPCWAWTRLLQFFSFHFRDIAAAYTWQQCTYTTVDFWIGIHFDAHLVYSPEIDFASFLVEFNICAVCYYVYVLSLLFVLYCRGLGAIGMDGMYCCHSFIDDSAFLVSYIS